MTAIQNEDKTIVAASGADMIYDSASGEHIECLFHVGPERWRKCGESFLVPEGWSIDWR